MKYLSLLKRWFPHVMVLLLALLTSCEGMLKDPMKDKETGDNIHLLIVDFNFFKTHITVNLFDATSGNRIELPAILTFAGKNGSDIVTYSGSKKQQHEILRGQLELTVDPGIKASESVPLSFSVTAVAEGYNTMAKTETFLSEGKKSVDIYLSRKSDETVTQVGGGVVTDGGDTTIVFGFAPIVNLKSASVDKPFRINYSLTLNDFLLLKDERGQLLFDSAGEFWDAYNADKENFLFLSITTFNTYPSWPDVLIKDGNAQNVILQILETGTIEYMSVGGKKVGSFNGAVMLATCSWTGLAEPATWGFAAFQNEGWLFKDKQLTIEGLPYSYTVIQASEQTICGLGATIRFDAAFISGFSIAADIYDMQGKRLYTQNFTGNFPASFVLENVPAVPAKLVFRDNNPSFKSIPDLEIANLCVGDYTVNVAPQDGFTGYQIVLKAFCENNPTVAVAPTYNGEYRFAGSSHPWQGGFMQGGVINLLGKPDQEYEYRLLWENQWETTSFTTTFNADGSYPYVSDSKISSEKLPDGRIRINVLHTFKQSVCDTMKW